MRRRRSLLLIALARWVLMSGLAGLVLAALAFIDGLRGGADAQSRHILLTISAVLLSLPFILAPWVRRAFDAASHRPRDSRKTLLEEMREQGTDAPSQSDATIFSPAPQRPRFPLRFVLLALYLLFAATLLAVMFAM